MARKNPNTTQIPPARSRKKVSRTGKRKKATANPRALPDFHKTSDTLTRARHMLRAAIKCYDQQEEEVDFGWATYEVLDMLERVQIDVDEGSDSQIGERYKEAMQELHWEGGVVMRNKAIPRALTHAEERGGMLCVEMLEAIAGENYANLTLDDAYREKCTPPRNVVAEYMDKLKGAGELAGFTRLLNKALSCNAHAGEPELGWLECVAQNAANEVAQSEWQKRMRQYHN